MAIELFTYDDAVQHLGDVFEAVVTNTVTRGRHARRAVDTVYRDFPNMVRWTYYVRRTTLKTVASYSTGTVAFDLTGGSSERMVTLTDGTWPSWARFGVLRLNSVDYRIATRVSDSIITLFEEDNPGADVSSGATYTISRPTYPLPVDFRKLLSLVDVTQSRQVPLISPQEWQRRRSLIHDNPGTPWAASIFGDGDYYGGLQLALEPPPSSIRSLDMLYEAKARDLNVVSYATGTVSTSGTTATFSGSGLPATVLPGAIVRFSADATAVTNKYGSNPFIEQRVLSAKTSATVWTLDQALTTDATSDAFSVSDPIEFENVAMQTAFLRCIEAEFAKMLNMDDHPARQALALRECRIAAGNDRREVAAQPGGSVRRDWSSLPVTTD